MGRFSGAFDASERMSYDIPDVLGAMVQKEIGCITIVYTQVG